MKRWSFFLGRAVDIALDALQRAGAGQSLPTHSSTHPPQHALPLTHPCLHLTHPLSSISSASSPSAHVHQHLTPPLTLTCISHHHTACILQRFAPTQSFSSPHLATSTLTTMCTPPFHLSSPASCSSTHRGLHLTHPLVLIRFQILRTCSSAPHLTSHHRLHLTPHSQASSTRPHPDSAPALTLICTLLLHSCPSTSQSFIHPHPHLFLCLVAATNDPGWSPSHPPLTLLIILALSLIFILI